MFGDDDLAASILPSGLSYLLGKNKETAKIEHVVLLVLENRSFDHMCGFLKQRNSAIDGLTGNESNPYDPQNPQGGSVKVNDKSGYITVVDPGHSVPSTTKQIFGFEPSRSRDPAPMTGFVRSYNEAGDKADKGAAVMQCFNPNTVPVISSLATQFAIFDRWYCSVPGPTQPNRLFIHSATSMGASTNDGLQLALGYPQRTIYDNLTAAGKTWRGYFHDIPSILFLQRLRAPEYWGYVENFSTFYEDCKNGTLPNYSFLEPRWFDLFNFRASDQHPPHDVRAGEYLIADVYEALRNGPKWNNTLLIITYDEHGGFFDHVPPPQTGVPAPDDHTSPEGHPPFSFERLGVRVPTIVVSPWINAGTLIHEPTPPKTGHWTHTSILSTVKKIFNLPEFLTRRDAWSPTFEDIVAGRSSPRTDCPTKLPRPGSVEDQAEWSQYSHLPTTPELIHQKVRDRVKWSDSPLTDLQYEMIAIARGLTPVESMEEAIAYAEGEVLTNEHEGALYVLRQITAFRRAQKKAAENSEWIVL